VGDDGQDGSGPEASKVAPREEGGAEGYGVVGGTEGVVEVGYEGPAFARVEEVGGWGLGGEGGRWVE